MKNEKSVVEIECCHIFAVTHRRQFDSALIHIGVVDGCYTDGEIYLLKLTGKYGVLEILNHETMHLILDKFIGELACEQYDNIAWLIDQYHKEE